VGAEQLPNNCKWIVVSNTTIGMLLADPSPAGAVLVGEPAPRRLPALRRAPGPQRRSRR
jgi:hypothetical protein